MKCTACKKDKDAVFRTNPLGELDAGWMCRPCIEKNHDASLIDPETQELVDILTKSNNMNGTFNFGQAVEAAKEGKRISREGWNGKGMFVFQRPADTLPGDFIPKVKSLPDSVKQFLARRGGDVSFGAYFCMLAADASIVNGWLASQTDMLATDWHILD